VLPFISFNCSTAAQQHCRAILTCNTQHRMNPMNSINSMNSMNSINSINPINPSNAMRSALLVLRSRSAKDGCSMRGTR
jgi:hypothetical protein